MTTTTIRKECSNERTDTSKKKILIIEDNILNIKLISAILEANNYEILQANNGNKGFATARACHPDLILMDMKLPDVSGMEVTRWIKDDEDLHMIPVIAVTASAMKGDAERMIEGGCQGYIPKPISINEFLKTVEAFLS